MSITTNVVSLNSAHGEVYSVQYYVIKFVSNLRQVSGFLDKSYAVFVDLLFFSSKINIQYTYVHCR